MTKHTIEFGKEEIRIVNVVKAVKEFSNIDDTLSFIIKDYAETNSYAKFIKTHGEQKDGNRKKSK